MDFSENSDIQAKLLALGPSITEVHVFPLPFFRDPAAQYLAIWIYFREKPAQEAMDETLSCLLDLYSRNYAAGFVGFECHIAMRQQSGGTIKFARASVRNQAMERIADTLKSRDDTTSRSDWFCNYGELH